MNPEILEKYPKSDKSTLIPILQDIQTRFGYLPEDALKDAAGYVGLPLSRVYGVATFYNQFRLLPLGENIIRVCRGTACHVKNSANLLFALENALGIKAGETTKDRKFTIELVNCIGACSIAPVITVNDEYFGRITTKDVPSIIKKFSGKPKASEKAPAGEVA